MIKILKNDKTLRRLLITSLLMTILVLLTKAYEDRTYPVPTEYLYDLSRRYYHPDSDPTVLQKNPEFKHALEAARADGLLTKSELKNIQKIEADINR
ncbi:hypothetical protein [Moraxella catarrhalis]|uniref:Uncharacterized protein n=1 Tax=Moraxella catarrhalis TaxID=480 RepID=A0A198UHF4_MORCA|nr:hypothetical protein [Moraxella catarrhalis]OAU94375.1 hypothetical protein AO383_2281 [Moraxella catarrhalis]OAU94657.1 hypothetical protein AO384_2014 [Moraxella catarrhalis]OAU97043.1 hypothetical protein AO385_1759 [Moraxella catarrhalis]